MSETGGKTALDERHREDLEFFYWDIGLTTAELAVEFGVSQPTVIGAMRRLGIDRREPGGITPDDGAPWRDPEVLERLYNGGGGLGPMSQNEIAERLGCSATTVRRHMYKNDIETRPPDWREREKAGR